MKILPYVMIVFGFAIWPVSSVKAGGPDSALNSVLNATYMIEKKKIQLNSGRSEVEVAPKSGIKITTTVFGHPIFGDLNGDGLEDAALILAHDPGGSGTFYYVAATLAENDNYQGTNAVFLGDRVALYTIQIRNGVINVNYADRRPDEPLAALPSVAKTMYLNLKEGYLEVIKDPW